MGAMGGQPCMIVCSFSQGGTVVMVGLDGVSRRWGDDCLLIESGWYCGDVGMGGG